MRGLATPHTRRKRPGAAAAAYSLALDVLRRPDEAELVTIHALRRGAHSRIGVVAHARHEAVERAGGDAPTLTSDIVGDDARTVAQQLTGTRPAIERAVIALENRYGLDAASFAQSLGLTSERALERVKEIALVWSEQLDPAMMAWSGPGACPQLASLLMNHGIAARNYSSTLSTLSATGTDELATTTTSTAPSTRIHDLLDVAPHVFQHTKTCATCNERMRLLTPVRTLIGQTPLESVPPRVVRAARTSRSRLPVALPPSIDPRRFTPEQTRTFLRSGMVIAAIAALVFGVVHLSQRHTDTQANRVARLIQSAPSSRLLATPTIMTRKSGTAALANNGDQVILWHATTNAGWLSVTPTNGRLAPNQSVSIVVHSGAIPANSPSDGSITFNGSDGSRQTIRYTVNN